MKQLYSHGLRHISEMCRGYLPATIFNQALPFLLLPVMTRFIPASEYGILSVFCLYQVVCQALIGSNMPNVVSKHFFDEDKQYVAKLVGNCIYTTLFLALAVALLILGIYLLGGGGYMVIPLRWFILLPLSSFAFVVLQLGLNICRNSKSISHFSILQVGSSIIEMGLSMLLVCILAWGWIGRAVGIVSAYILSAIVVLILLHKCGYIMFTWSKDMLREIRQVVFPLISYSTIMTLVARSGVYFMQFFFTNELAGLYATAAQVAIFVSLFGDSINVTWSSYLYEQLALGERCKVRVTKLLWVLYAILLLGVIFSTWLAEPILHIMTTPEYYGTTEFVVWVALGIAVSRMYLFILPILIKNNQQRFINVAAYISFIAMLLMTYFFAQWFGYMGVAYAYLATYSLMAIILFTKVQYVYPLPWLKALFIWK